MVKFAGNEVTLVGSALKVGQVAPDFILRDKTLGQKSLSDFEGIKLISVIPSIDTGVCDAQTRKFNEEVSQLEGVSLITVSVDLPFAQARWCAVAGIDGAITLSDYFDHNFGKSYGVLMEETNLLARAVFVLDKDNKITYLEYVPEVTAHPDYDEALKAVKSL